MRVHDPKKKPPTALRSDAKRTEHPPQDGMVTREGGKLVNTRLHYEAADRPETAEDIEQAVLQLIEFGLTREEAEAIT